MKRYKALAKPLRSDRFFFPSKPGNFSSRISQEKYSGR